MKMFTDHLHPQTFNRLHELFYLHSPGSKQVSYEQPGAPEQGATQQAHVLKQPTRKSVSEKRADRPAGCLGAGYEKFSHKTKVKVIRVPHREQ